MRNQLLSIRLESHELLVPKLMCGDIRLAQAERVVEGTA